MFNCAFARVLVLRARLVMVEASEEVRVVPLARCARLRMNI